ncbi:unnamed protein product [Coffea canephora]|uniref:Protein NIM1-INTERACTING 2-like n=2 Tax=Coffea TaxID=13442 RepID=A0A068TSW4_COFCA|nr:protein NIM1-INTERACTING 2-like [Coffea arabica]CDO98438.1 unnamed protein product [Coffea canephora]
MEDEKKRKRAADHGCGGERRKKRRKDVEDEVVEAETAAAQPSEEEVEEFFTILRRMHVAVKYFEKSGSNSTYIDVVNGDGGKMTESPAEEGVQGVKIGGKRDVNGVGLDLNAVPEADT